MPSIAPSCEPEEARGIKNIVSKANFPTPRLIRNPDFPKIGLYGWVYGWKLHVVSVVAAVWFPIAAILTPANIADSESAPALLCEVPAEMRFVLGDLHYKTPDLHEHCVQADRLLVTTKYGRYPHTDDGVEVRRIFHKLRSMPWKISMSISKPSLMDMEKFHQRLTGYSTIRVGCHFVYQLALLYGFEHDLGLCVGLKAFLKAA